MKFTLECENEHSFEGWFRSNDDYEKQAKRGFLQCPVCGSSRIGKSLMAPSVSTGRKKDMMALAASTQAQREIMGKMMELARAVKANAENVGNRFAEEARRIHDGEAEKRGIYGKATPEEVEALHEDGIAVIPLPDVPEEEELN